MTSTTLTTHPTPTGYHLNIYNPSTRREVGITVPLTHLWTFINRRYYEGANESVEVLTTSKGIVINIKTNFRRQMTSTAIITPAAFSKIEIQITDILLHAINPSITIE